MEQRSSMMAVPSAGGEGMDRWKYSSASTLRDSDMSAVPTWKRPSSDSLLTSMARSPAVRASSCSPRRVDISLKRHQPRSSSGTKPVYVCAKSQCMK